MNRLIVAFALFVAALCAALPIASQASDRHYLACAAPTLPVTVTIEEGVDADLVRSAMAEWNTAAGRDVFVESDAGFVHVKPSTSTWVDMPCGSHAGRAVVYLGGSTNLTYWTAHELGHTLGLADHIGEGVDETRYLNPGHCPTDGYDGIMSYCTPRERWFGEGDVAMMATVFGGVE